MIILQDFLLILLFKELKVFVLAFNNTEGNAKVGRNNDQKYFLPGVNITTTC